ncbi:MAG: hypothetical protein INR71_06760, partial [Terriglobus roseus]|nr:hypothetical protein [Terriglobus roseus]
ATAMPGLLLPADTMGAERVTNGVVAAPHQQHQQQQQQPPDAQKRSAGAQLTNGDSMKPHADAAAPAPNGLAAAASPMPALDLPDEILDILAQSFSPLSQLIERVAQECFNELNDVLGKMADEDVAVPPPQPPAVNGAAPSIAASMNGTGAAVAASVKKKRLVLDFANRHREKFIKLLVLSQWSRRAEDVQRLVRLKTWLDMRLQDFVQSADSIGILKQNLHTFKEPNPDIRTALETLSSGTASWIPDV